MKRLQFLMSDELVKELDALVEETGLKTRTQLLNTALTLFEWAVKERKDGRIIASVDEKADKYKEIDLPGLPAVKQEENIDTLLRQLGPLLKTDDQKQLAAELLGIGDIWPEDLLPLKASAIWGEFTSPPGTETAEEEFIHTEVAATLGYLARIAGPKTAAALAYLARTGGDAEVRRTATVLAKNAFYRAEELHKREQEAADQLPSRMEEAETAPDRSHPKEK